MRLEIVERTLAWEHDRQRFRRAWRRADAKLRKALESARKRLSAVRLPNAAIEAVARAMSELGVDGQRPDLATVRAAMAWAALEKRDEVDREALETVAQICVGHRTRGGGLEQPPTGEELSEALSSAFSRAWKGGSRTYFNPEETLKELQ